MRRRRRTPNTQEGEDCVGRGEGGVGSRGAAGHARIRGGGVGEVFVVDNQQRQQQRRGGSMYARPLEEGAPLAGEN